MKLAGSAPASLKMYCTPEEVRGDNELLRADEVFSDEMILPYIIKAQQRMDVKLAKRYVVPISEPVPGILQSIAVDMAAGFTLVGEIASRLSQEVLNLGNGKIRRAESDLADVVRDGLLDGLPGVQLAGAGSSTTPAMASTTPEKSPLERALNW